MSPNTLNPTARGLLWMLLSTALLSTMHAMVRHLASGMHPFEIAFFRNLFGFAAVLPLLYGAGMAGLRSAQPRLQVIRGLTGIVAMLAWFYGLSITPLATATSLSFSAAIFASLGAVIMLHERMHLRRWSAVLAGLAGVLIVLRPGATAFEPGALYILLSTLLWGFNVVIVKRLSATDSTVSIVAWMSASLTLLSVLPAMTVWVTPSTTQLLWLAAIGTAGTGGHLAMVRALKLADTTAVMSVDFTRLIWTTLIGSLVFGDLLDVWAWFGGSLIFASGLYIIFRESRAPATPPAPAPAPADDRAAQ